MQDPRIIEVRINPYEEPPYMIVAGNYYVMWGLRKENGSYHLDPAKRQPLFMAGEHVPVLRKDITDETHPLAATLRLSEDAVVYIAGQLDKKELPKDFVSRFNRFLAKAEPVDLEHSL